MVISDSGLGDVEAGLLALETCMDTLANLVAFSDTDSSLVDVEESLLPLEMHMDMCWQTCILMCK